MAVSPRLRKQIWRANKMVSMAELMQRFGYQVTSADSEQQFACDLHGRDTKPSARLYPRTNSSFCWACHKSRRPVDLVQERNGLSLEQSVAFLEEMFHLPSLPLIEDEPEEDIVPSSETTFEDEFHRTDRLLATVTQERSVPMDRALWAWECLDKLMFRKEQDEVNETAARAVLCTLREKVLAEIQS